MREQTQRGAYVRRRSARWWIAAVAVAGLANPGGEAAGQADQRLYKFRLPEYRDDGTLKSMMVGGAATVKPGALVEIEDLRIEFFEDDGEELQMRVEAPHCLYNRAGEIAKSPGDVRIEAKNIEVTGTDFAWDRKRELFKIFKDAKVVLRNMKDKVPTE